MSDPAPAPAPIPAPTAVPTTPSAGLLTSEGILTFIVAVLGLLPSSGLFPETSPIVKIAGLIVGGLAAVGYQYQRTQLKIAHLSSQNDN